MTLALIIICLMVLLVIVDESETSGHGSEEAMPPAEESDRSASGRPCILGVRSVRRRGQQDPRKHAWKPTREVETETTPR